MKPVRFLSILEDFLLNPASAAPAPTAATPPAAPPAAPARRAPMELVRGRESSDSAWLPPVGVEDRLGECREREHAREPLGPDAVVLGRPEHVVYTAAALAHQLRSRTKASTAAVLVWGVDPPAGGGRPTDGARRLSQRLLAADLPATPCGRLVTIALGAQADQAALVAEKVWSRASEIPCVLALAGARPEAFDRHLPRHSLAVLVTPAGEPVAVTALAKAQLAGNIARVATVGPMPPAARKLALTGMTLGAPLRDLAAEAVFPA